MKTNKILLLYNFGSERAALVKNAVAPLGCTVRTVSKKEYALPVGALAGVPGIPHLKQPDGGDFGCEMLVINGFSGEGIDILIGALYRGGVGRIPYKAVVTETNACWTPARLFGEIKAEHEAMKGTG